MILHANNKIHHSIDNRLQFDFFINIIRKRKRFSKWFKPELISDLEVVKKYYGYSNEKARQVLTLLSTEQINELKNKVAKGVISEKKSELLGIITLLDLLDYMCVCCSWK